MGHWPRQRGVQREVIGLLRDGWTVDDIVDETGITENEVRRIKRFVRSGGVTEERPDKRNSFAKTFGGEKCKQK